jgi:membrane protease YdiL (CAAX protease family)
MTTFQFSALLLIIIWLLVVIVWFRRSIIVLIGGLLVVGVFTIGAFIFGKVTMTELGLNTNVAWLSTAGFALVGLVLMILYSPIADRLASRIFPQQPTLDTFRSIQHSKLNLVLGILAAWILGGILEELLARGIVLQAIKTWLLQWIGQPMAAAIAVLIAALGAGAFHLYQGPRAVLIISQLSVLLGILFVVSGYNLWAVILCHGLYDSIAFVRFANRQSKYSRLNQDQASSPGSSNPNP